MRLADSTPEPEVVIGWVDSWSEVSDSEIFGEEPVIAVAGRLPLLKHAGGWFRDLDEAEVGLGVSPHHHWSVLVDADDRVLGVEFTTTVGSNWITHRLVPVVPTTVSLGSLDAASLRRSG